MGKFYQVSTLQALALGFSKPVIKVGELLEHGDLGLGTFEDVDGRSESGTKAHHVTLKDQQF